MNALKEWATVVRALESGEQTVLLRKGGILETASGFVIESKKFLLFPTYEHQAFDNIKPQFHAHLEFVKNHVPPQGTNTIASYAEVLAESDIKSEKTIGRLADFHIWSDSYVKTRMGWMPQKAMKAIFLKTYRIPDITITLKPEYQGCKSWIDINANLESGRPVLGESEIASRLEKFKEIVS
ncbi:DUF1802 family protein [Candidatus Nitrosotenuis uzonensis]|uniref:DUF1802 family protein n=1 Tax=Candidatus Nitrosotenuis uzonensis TaxID=1407055 RepID=V6AQZ2_9ARCH|nr:DUF1802 family protein [Candidatus Nitrosotenuis uzonensis]CDI04833.1 conserved hypothetical protein [Candidatus Nitrosotenuis uzonensis]